MKIAIIGAGFAGLATTWTLLQCKTKNLPIQVTLFDSKGIGAESSGVAAGLMHPFANTHAKLNREGYEGYQSCLGLLAAATNALGYPPFDSSGILRPALSPAQEKEFYIASQKYPETIDWKNSAEMQVILPNVMEAPGIWIKKGVTVFTDEYLRGLYMACEELGARLQIQRVNSVCELNAFDLVIFAMGSNSASLKELSHLPLRYTKGQILELLWPEDLPPLPMALNGNMYCVMSRDRKRCLVGSTYEKQFKSAETDLDIAKEWILPKLTQLYPPLKEAKVIGCRAGIRVSTPQHLPLITQINSRCYVIVGLGSKGLLYHGLYSQKLRDLILQQT